MKRLFLISMVLLNLTVYGQVPDTLNLERCHYMAVSNHPTARQTGLLSSASEIQQKKLNANYLPQLQINGQASYQSDVPQVDVEIPPFYIPPPIDMQVSPAPLNTPVPPKDQYRFTMDVSQVIYDGGMTGKRKDIDLTAYEMEMKQVEVALHRLKENVNAIYFSIILMQENEKLLIVLLENLNTKLKDVDAAVEYGAALSSDRDVLRAEIIRVEQQLDETAIQRQAFINILSELVSTKLPDDIVLSMPKHLVASGGYSPQRPELELYELKRGMFEDSKELITSSWRPKLSGFGQLGYGNPGLNVLKDEWTPFYMVGARLSWQIWNWNQNKKEKQILGLKQEIVNSEEEVFDKNLNITLEQYLADMRKYEHMMEQDYEVIRLRVNIAATASSQFANGVITSSDYVSRLNEEAQARLNLEVHRVKLAKARVDYLTSLGIL